MERWQPGPIGDWRELRSAVAGYLIEGDGVPGLDGGIVLGEAVVAGLYCHIPPDRLQIVVSVGHEHCAGVDEAHRFDLSPSVVFEASIEGGPGNAGGDQFVCGHNSGTPNREDIVASGDAEDSKDEQDDDGDRGKTAANRLLVEADQEDEGDGQDRKEIAVIQIVEGSSVQEETDIGKGERAEQDKDLCPCRDSEAG